MDILKNLPISLFGNLSPAELARYSKQLLLPDWGVAAQEKIKAAKVFIAGAGGLVSAAAFNLVAAGVGSLRVVNAQRVCLQDLGDQLLYRERDLNKPKVPVLRSRLQEANPFSAVEGLERKISDHNALKLIKGADLLLADLSDAQTAAVLNRAALKARIPLVLAWIHNMRGYITTLKPGQGLCLECTSLTERLHTSQASMAPMGAIVGGLMALEALRILGGPGPALWNRVFGYDGDVCQCLEEPLRRQKECGVCRRLS